MLAMRRRARTLEWLLAVPPTSRLCWFSCPHSADGARSSGSSSTWRATPRRVARVGVGARGSSAWCSFADEVSVSRGVFTAGCCSCPPDASTANASIPQGTGSAQPIQSDDEGEVKEPNCLLLEPDFQLMQALMESQQNFTISDPSMPDNPIVYASQVGRWVFRGDLWEPLASRSRRLVMT